MALLISYGITCLCHECIVSMHVMWLTKHLSKGWHILKVWLGSNEKNFIMFFFPFYEGLWLRLGSYHMIHSPCLYTQYLSNLIHPWLLWLGYHTHFFFLSTLSHYRKKRPWLHGVRSDGSLHREPQLPQFIQSPVFTRYRRSSHCHHHLPFIIHNKHLQSRIFMAWPLFE